MRSLFEQDSSRSTTHEKQNTRGNRTQSMYLKPQPGQMDFSTNSAVSPFQRISGAQKPILKAAQNNKSPLKKQSISFIQPEKMQAP